MLRSLLTATSPVALMAADAATGTPAATGAPAPETEKKKRLAFTKWSKRRKPGDAHTIVSFCEANAISESKYYALKRDGKGPREINLDGRVIISPQAVDDWRREREAETAAKPPKPRKTSTTTVTAA